MRVTGILTDANSSLRTQSEVIKDVRTPYQDAIGNWIMGNFPDEQLGSMAERGWLRAPGLFRVPVCDWETWRWNYENWSLNRHPSKEERCSRYPCCPPHAP
jgi:hypothetical protein